MARIEIEERLVLHRTFRFTQVLPTESLVGKHSEVKLRVGRHVAADRVVPDAEVGQLGGVIRSREKAYLIDRRFVNLVVVLIFEGIDPVGNRLEVLGDENTVGFRTGDHRRLVFEHRRVVFGNILHRIGRKEINEALGYAVGRVAVGRISRNDH